MFKKSLLLMLLMALFAPLAMHSQTKETQTFDFEDNAIPATWTNDATYPWEITSTKNHTEGGTYSIKSGNAGENSTTSSIEATFTFAGDGSISFYSWSSCESASYAWDYGIFYIDGEQMDQFLLVTEWTAKSYDVDAGTHTFKWSYTKDSSVGSNDDCFYIDDIVVDLGVASSCPKPTGLTATIIPGEGTKTTFEWIENGTATSWQLCLNNDETDLIPMDSNPFTYDQLTPEQTYTAKVRACCSATDQSAWSNTVTFTPTNSYMLTVNDGTTTNEYVPFYGWYADSNTDGLFIIPAESLSAMQWGTINKLTFYVQSPETAGFVSTTYGTTAKFEVYMVETTETTLSSTTISFDGMTKVMNEAQLVIEDYMMTVTLDAPYQYLGGNLMIGFDETTSGGYAHTYWYGVEATGASVGGYGTSFAQKNFLPKTTFTYEPGEEPTCPKPTGFTAGTPDTYSVELSWNAGGDEREWEIIYKMADDDYEEGRTVTTEENPYLLEDLRPATTYNAKVRAICEEASDWSNEITFITDVTCPAPKSLTIEEASESAALAWTSTAENFDIWYRELVSSPDTDFEDGIGAWTTIDADGDGFTWESHINTGTGNYNTHSGDGCMVSGSYDGDSGVALTPDNYLVSPRIELGGSITFWACAQDASWPSEHFGLAVSTTGNTDAADFTTIQEWDMTAKGTAQRGSGMASRSGNRDSGTYYEYTVDLSDYAGDFGYVAIRHFDCTDWFYLDVDDITIVQPNGVAVPDWTEATSARNSYTITGLTPETQYEVQVRANCGDDEYSEWTYDTFWTLPLCVAPTISDYEVGTDYITLSWESEAEAFDIALDGETIETAYEGYTYTFEDLDPGTQYRVTVRTNCGEDGTSTWVGGYLTTECETFALPYEYNFDDVLYSNSPDYNCWAVGSSMSTSPSLYYRDQDAGDIMFTFVAYGNTVSGIQYLITPELETTSNPILVEFEYEAEFDNESYGYDYETFQVGYSEDGDSFEWLDEVEVTSVEEWETFSEEVPAGTKYIAIVYISPGALYLNIDNFSFTEVEGGDVTQTIQLTEGWNWVSINLVIDDPVDMLDQLKEKLGDNAEQIQSFEYSTDYEGDGEWFGDLDDEGITNEQMYMINAVADCEIVLEGTEVAAAENYTIEINEGWNWIGFPNAEPIDINEALPDFEGEDGDQIQSKDYTADYEGVGEWFGDLETLNPGEGYMYLSNNTETQYLTFYTGAKKSARRTNFNLSGLQKQGKKVLSNMETKSGGKIKLLHDSIKRK